MEGRVLRLRKGGVTGSEAASSSAPANPRKRKTRSTRKGRKKRPRLDIDDTEDEEEQEQEVDAEEVEGDEGEDDEDERIVERFSSGRAKKGKKGQGQNSVHWDKHKRIILNGLNKTPGSLLDAASRGPGKLNRNAVSTKKWFDEKCPPVTMEMLLGRLPDPQQEIDDVWTQAREAELLSRYPEDHPYRVYVETSEENLTTNYWSMYRKICRVRGVFPEDIIGERTMLRYGEEVEIGRRDWRPTPNWTKNFCKRLEKLAISSPCNDNMNLLALFIRYAVACQVNDRRVVPLGDSKTGQMFFELMTAVMKEARGSKSLPEIGEDARSRWTSKGWKLPWEARVLQGLEEIAYDGEAPAIEEEEEREDPGPYQVNADDLGYLIVVFGKVADAGHPVNYDMDDRQSVVSYARSSKDAPSDIGELGKLRWALVLSGMRFQEKRRLLRQQGGLREESVVDAHLGLVGRAIAIRQEPNEANPVSEPPLESDGSQAIDDGDGDGDDSDDDDDIDDDGEDDNGGGDNRLGERKGCNIS
ncbi:hypothetical protein F5Y05DRAFT_421873 [Hypoxylon sp. FL0543]|nr:hypothetical protein F5Y05DRAFT_421873 [Hypoxylon sp. FL0543]